MPTGNRIYTKVNRPPKSLVDKFAGLAACDVADCLNKLASMDAGIKPMNGVKLLGTAVTVRVPQGNNLFFHRALDLVQEGDVIVVDGGGFTDRALCGENMMEIAMRNGAVGFVVDGAVRDIDAFCRAENFSLYARAVVPNSSYKLAAPGEINVPVTVGGITVFPGDILLGDECGVVVVHPEDAEQVCSAAAELAAKQAKNLELIKAGTSNREWVKKLLDEIGCEEIDEVWKK